MADIINIDDARINVTEEDVFELFMIFKHIQKNYYNVNLDMLMESLGKYSEMARFYDIYKNLNVKRSENGKFFVDLIQVFEKEKKEKRIIESPNEKHLFCVIIPEDELEKMKEKYNKDILYLFDILMFYVSQDLEYGLDGWDLVAEDEYIKIPNYPGVVTGEFIGKKKNGIVLKKVKQQAIKNLKNEYE